MPRSIPLTAGAKAGRGLATPTRRRWSACTTWPACWGLWAKWRKQSSSSAKSPRSAARPSLGTEGRVVSTKLCRSSAPFVGSRQVATFRCCCSYLLCSPLTAALFRSVCPRRPARGDHQLGQEIGPAPEGPVLDSRVRLKAGSGHCILSTEHPHRSNMYPWSNVELKSKLSILQACLQLQCSAVRFCSLQQLILGLRIGSRFRKLL